jgi:hypothetical protein
MRKHLLAVCAAAFLLSGCYHVTVVTGKPASSNAITRPWQHSFVYGLVPPAEINSSSECPNGVSKVETQHSFLNGLVAALTWSLYTPIQVDIQCAS